MKAAVTVRDALKKLMLWENSGKLLRRLLSSNAVRVSSEQPFSKHLWRVAVVKALITLPKLWGSVRNFTIFGDFWNEDLEFEHWHESRGVVRTLANIQDGEFFNTTKTVNYCSKVLHIRCLQASWLTPLLKIKKDIEKSPVFICCHMPSLECSFHITCISNNRFNKIIKLKGSNF